jgi:hypothetical protein
MNRSRLLPIDHTQVLTPTERLLCLVLLMTGLGSYLALGVWVPLFTNLNDFHSTWEAGQVYLEGGDPYWRYHQYKDLDAESYQGNHKFFLYPPLVVMAVTPLSALPWTAAKLTWHLLNVLLGLVTLVVLLWVMGDRLGKVEASLFAMMYGTFYPVLSNNLFGNYDTFIALCMAGAFVAVRKGQGYAGGALLALGTALKIFPAFLLVYFAWRRQWRVVVGGVLVGALLFGLSLTGMSLGKQLAWLEMATHLDRSYASAVNQTVLGWSLRLFTHDPIFSRGIMDAPEVAKGVAWVLRGLLVLGLFALTWRRGDPQGHRERLGFGLAALTMFLVPEFSNVHHFTLALIPTWAILLLARECRLGWPLAGTALLAHGLLAFLIPSYSFKLLSAGAFGWLLEGWPVLLLSESLYCLLALWGVTAWALWRVAE